MSVPVSAELPCVCLSVPVSAELPCVCVSVPVSAELPCVCVSRCLAVCPSLVSLDVSGNPAVTSAGLEAVLTALRDGHRTLELLNLQGRRCAAANEPAV